jgi:hypothetical protein
MPCSTVILARFRDIVASKAITLPTLYKPSYGHCRASNFSFLLCSLVLVLCYAIVEGRVKVRPGFKRRAILGFAHDRNQNLELRM